MATRRPVLFSRAEKTEGDVQMENEGSVVIETNPCTRRRMYLHLVKMGL